MEISFKHLVFSSFFSVGSGQKVTNVQDKDSGGPIGIPSLPPVHKNPGVQVKSTTSGSSREQSIDDEVERKAEMTQGMHPADVKRVRRNDFMIRVRLCRMWDVINHEKMIEEEMILNPMDIKELFDSEWSPEIQVSADVSLGNLKDPEDELDVTDGGKSRKKDT
ncbi:hypothetical protein CQW23_07079 [Capsicum baccatum]|uniref:Uncharacterized protein n=1 Tax=Capsicum baccatum TaxID=33114 RepID=A0A2G2X571_CAPBA|nr:hypothetical protein CQW23_07079 [Capsicum baccatum]